MIPSVEIGIAPTIQTAPMFYGIAYATARACTRLTCSFKSGGEVLFPRPLLLQLSVALRFHRVLLALYPMRLATHHVACTVSGFRRAQAHTPLIRGSATVG